MHIVTIMNYDAADVRTAVMCDMWMDCVQRANPGAAVTVIVGRPPISCAHRHLRFGADDRPLSGLAGAIISRYPGADDRPLSTNAAGKPG